MDMPGNITVEWLGMRSLPVQIMGHKKDWFTVLAAMANGRKLMPFVMFKGVRLIAELNSVPGVVPLSKNGWMNEMLTINWVK